MKIFKNIFIFTPVLFLVAFSLAHGENVVLSDLLSSFRKYKDISNISVKVPSVIEIPIENDFFERFDFVVVNTKNQKIEPSYFKEDVNTKKTKLYASSRTLNGDLVLVVDNNPASYQSFAVEKDVNIAEIILSGDAPITSTGLTILLDNFVALPSYIEIFAQVNGVDEVVVSKKPLYAQSIQFPKTTSNKWTVLFYYSQPLRISEIFLKEENPIKNTERGLRFLAQPGEKYRAYFDSDKRVSVSFEESGNLINNEGVIKLNIVPTLINPAYKPSDFDQDGIFDIGDNCISEPNFDQKDVDGNGRGDVCDDFDRDGLINAKDNCPNNPNLNQEDKDGDRVGDVCDEKESRVTEAYPFLPWIGIGFAAFVLIILFFLVARQKPAK